MITEEKRLKLRHLGISSCFGKTQNLNMGAGVAVERRENGNSTKELKGLIECEEKSDDLGEVSLSF